MHVDGRLLAFALCLSRLPRLPHDVTLLILVKAKLNRVREIIETRPEPFAGRSTFAKRRRAKRLGICFKCANYIHFDDKCRWWREMLRSRNSDHLHFIKYGKSKGATLETPSDFEWYRRSFREAVERLLESSMS